MKVSQDEYKKISFESTHNISPYINDNAENRERIDKTDQSLIHFILRGLGVEKQITRLPCPEKRGNSRINKQE